MNDVVVTPVAWGTHPRLLVIRRDNIGDLVCTTPLIAALRARYPKAFIAALVNSYNAAVLDGNPDLDAVYAYTKLKHRERGQSLAHAVLAHMRLLRTLRRQRFDCAMLAKSGFDRHGLYLARAAFPRHIVGFAPEGQAAPRALSLPLPPPRAGELHEVEVVMRLASVLDVTAPPGPLRVFPSERKIAQWCSRLPQLAGERGRTWVALHLSARESGRRWETDRFVSLVQGLTAECDIGVVLLWAPGTSDNPRHPGDDEKAAEILRRLQANASVCAAPTKELNDLTAVLSLCDAFIGADGGAMHLAAALSLPMVALFENLPHKKCHWYPWQVRHVLVSPQTRDIGDITVDEVMHAWERLAVQRAGRGPEAGLR